MRIYWEYITLAFLFEVAEEEGLSIGLVGLKGNKQEGKGIRCNLNVRNVRKY
jgi:hypothetical protein